MSSLQSHLNQSNSTTPSLQSLSLDDISNYFCLPLSDAASNLGVCVSVLKKICHENGLDRWPYRKVLAGKSIEDIKKQAARERSKERSEIAKAAGQSVSQHQNNGSLNLQGSASPHKLHQHGNKDAQASRPQTVLTSGLMKGMMALDEFRLGFPSDGLSVSANRWWDSSSFKGYKDIDKDEADADEDDKHDSGDRGNDDGGDSMIVDENKPTKGKIESSNEDIDLLTSVRKRAAEEGLEALRLCTSRSHGINKISKKEGALLVRLFGPSLPKQVVEGCF